MRGACSLTLVLLACAHPPSGGTGAEEPVRGRACNPPTRIELLKEGSIGAKWNSVSRVLAYGRPGADGRYDIYLADAAGQNERRLSYPGWLDDRHQWAEEWHPSGKYLFALVEKADIAPEPSHRRIPEDAIPGYGGYTDLWLVTPDGQKAWKLIDTPNDYDHGIIHCAVSADGSQFAWTERVQRPNFLDLNPAAGAYVFKVADFVDGPTPRLVSRSGSTASPAPCRSSTTGASTATS